MSLNPAGSIQEPVAFTRPFGLAREMTLHTRKLHRDLRPVLGDSLLTAAQEMTVEIGETAIEIEG